MNYPRNEYTVFISYFGTYLSNGTKGLALQAKAIIDKTAEGKSYCGPDEDEHTFLQHMDDVIPKCSLFLFVVNDDCPRSNSGAIGNQATFVIKEIQTFVNLVKLGERNTKDFAVLYAGNLLLDMDQKINYVKTLLQEVDPEHLLSEGNHHLILDYNTLSSWVNIRMHLPYSDIHSPDEEPIDFIHEELDAFLSSEKNGIVFIEMEEGMGKTSFIHQRELLARTKDDEIAVFIYANSENDYSQLVDFPLELYKKLSEELPLRKKRELHHIDSFQKDMGVAFSAFINQIKNTAYPNKRIVIYLDCIESLGKVEDKTILDYFCDVEGWSEGVFVVATKRPGTIIKAQIKERNDGQRTSVLSIARNDSRYKRFLRRYFHGYIGPKLEVSGIDDTRIVYESLQPQTIMIFSLYRRMIEIYASEHKERNGMLDEVKDMDAIIKYYFTILSLKYSKETFSDYLAFLYLLSIVSLQLEQEDILYLVGHSYIKKDYLDESDSSNYLFRVFITTRHENGRTFFSLLHTGIGKLLRFEWALRDSINSRLMDGIIALTQRCNNDLDMYYKEGGTLLLFVYPLLKSNDVEKEEKGELVQILSVLPFVNGWDKEVFFRQREELVLRAIKDYHDNLIPRTKLGKCLSVLGNDLYIDGRLSESKLILWHAMDIYAECDVSSFGDDELYDYQELKSLISTCAQAMGYSDIAVSSYEDLVEIIEKLYGRGYAKTDARYYVRNIACLGHVYGHAKAFDKQITTLNRAEHLYVSLNVNDLDVLNFIEFGKAYYYYDVKDYSNASVTAKKVIERYIEIRDNGNTRFYYGNVLDCLRLLFEIMIASPDQSATEEVDKAIESYEIVKSYQWQDDEYNYFYNTTADEALAKLLFHIDKRREAKSLCRNIVELIEKNKLDLEDENYMEIKKRIIKLEKSEAESDGPNI